MLGDVPFVYGERSVHVYCDCVVSVGLEATLAFDDETGYAVALVLFGFRGCDNARARGIAEHCMSKRSDGIVVGGRSGVLVAYVSASGRVERTTLRGRMTYGYFGLV